MTHINLLPWREQKHEQDKKLFTIMLVVAALTGIIIVFTVNYYASSLVKNQEQRNQILQTEITSLDNQIREIKALSLMRESLISRMSIVQNLQSTRTLMVHLFDELIRVMPSGVYITKIERKDELVTMWGYSESNTYISELMRNIEGDDWFQNPVLTEIKKSEEETQAANNEFKLSFILKAKY